MQTVQGRREEEDQRGRPQEGKTALKSRGERSVNAGGSVADLICRPLKRAGSASGSAMRAHERGVKAAARQHRTNGSKRQPYTHVVCALWGRRT